jgi:hypothetical protein
MKAATEAKQTEEKYDKRENKKQKRGKKCFLNGKFTLALGFAELFILFMKLASMMLS